MRWLIAAALAIAAAAAALVLAPRAIDWNAYRGEIAGLVEQITGRRLTIEGDVRLRLLPTPTLSASGVRLANLPGAATPDMIRLKSLDARVALGPLFRGRVVVESLALVEPAIVLERLADGRRNWDFGQAPAPEDFMAEVGDDLAVKRLIIVGGTVAWADGARIERVSGINAELVADRLSGPFQLVGDVRWRELPLRVEATTGWFAPAGTTSVSATITVRDGGDARFIGTVAQEPGGTRLAGGLRLDLARPGDLLAAFGVDLPAILGPRLVLEAPINLDAARLTVGPATVRLGEARASLDLIRDRVRDHTELTARIDFVDLDRWPAGSADPKRPEGDPWALLDLATRRFPGHWTLVGEGAQWRGQPTRAIKLEVDALPGRLAIRQASLQAPGGTEVTLWGGAEVGAIREFAGSADIGAESARALMEWIGVALPPADADRWRRLSATASLRVTDAAIAISDLDMRIDVARVRGAATIGRQTRPTIAANLDVDRLNLDAYLPPAEVLTLDPVAWAARADLNVALRVGQLTWRELVLEELVARASAVTGRIAVEEAAFKRATGEWVRASGLILPLADTAAGPGVQATIDGEIVDFRPWLRVAGVDEPRFDTGQTRFTARVAGTLALPRVEVSATVGDGSRVQVDAGLGPDRARRAVDVVVEAPHLPAALARLAPELPLMIDRTRRLVLRARAVPIEGGWRVDPASVESGESTAAIRATVGADLRPTEVDVTGSGWAFDTGQTQQLADLARGLTAPSRGPRVRLALTELAVAGVPIDRLEATLSGQGDGLTLEDLKASVWGGAVVARGRPFAADSGLVVALRGLDLGMVARRFDWGEDWAGQLAASLRLHIAAEVTPVGQGRFDATLTRLPGIGLADATARLPDPPVDPATLDAALARFESALADGVVANAISSGSLVMTQEGFAIPEALVSWADGLAALSGRRVYRDGATTLNLTVRPARDGLPPFDLAVTRAAEGTRRVLNAPRLRALLVAPRPPPG